MPNGMGWKSDENANKIAGFQEALTILEKYMDEDMNYHFDISSNKLGIEVLVTRDAIPSSWEDYKRLEELGWKVIKGSAFWTYVL